MSYYVTLDYRSRMGENVEFIVSPGERDRRTVCGRCAQSKLVNGCAIKVAASQPRQCS